MLHVSWKAIATSLLTATALLLPISAATAPPAAASTGHGQAHKVGPARGKHPVTGHHTASTRGGNFTTQNWAGYIARNPTDSDTTSFNSVEASWTVPAVTCDANNIEDALFWVGLDGWNNGTVEQDGIEASCVDGTITYNAWWEEFPFNNVETEFAVSAGDSIHASVNFDSSTSEFVFSVEDLTSGQSFTQDFACQPGLTCTRSSAEVITEDNNISNLEPTLPDYGTASYNSISVTGADGHTGPITDPEWQFDKSDEVSAFGVTKQVTSALGADGASFSTTWVAGNGCNNQPEVTAEYETFGTSPTANTISANFELENIGCFSIPMSSLTVRYWFTEDGSSPMGFACDFANLGCTSISGSFTSVPPVAEADHYVQLGFSSGLPDLGSGGNTGIIQTRVFRTDFANMTQTNDWSFNASDSTFTANPHITVYYNGQLIYGTEPS